MNKKGIIIGFTLLTFILLSSTLKAQRQQPLYPHDAWCGSDPSKTFTYCYGNGNLILLGIGLWRNPIAALKVIPEIFYMDPIFTPVWFGVVSVPITILIILLIFFIWHRRKQRRYR